MAKLSKTMTVAAFDRGYWYADELKKFAKSIGIIGLSKLRKDEVEDLVRFFLKNGKVRQKREQALSTKMIPDVDRGLIPNLAVRSYVNNKDTWAFIESLAREVDAKYKRKSGARYRLNRWREDQQRKETVFTYLQLAEEYVRLSRTEGAFPQVRSGRYINFLSQFHNHNKNAKREEAIAAWHELKKFDIPKTYSAWAKRNT